MRILVYEHLTALGPSASDPGMYREGKAMRDAAVADFARIPGVEMVIFGDADAPVTLEWVAEAAAGADWSLLIAPEMDSCLASLAEAVLRAGGRLLGPSPEAIRLTSDKFSLFQHWREHHVPTPATSDRPLGRCEAFPIVWKPRDGAGSTLTFLLHSAQDVVRVQAIHARERHAGPMILQEHVAGQPCSIAFLCGPAGNVPLLPASQRLSEDGRFAYLGGDLPLPPRLYKRAEQLGRRAIDCFPGLLGYVGVDLVLGAATDGSQDYAIEINPRLTTSYVGLRCLAVTNLAEAMLKAAKGETASPRWKPGSVKFDADGQVCDCSEV